MKNKLVIPEPVKDYTVVHEFTFFDLNERASLKDLREVYTMEALAKLIQEGYLVRDCTTIKPKTNV